MRKEPNSIWIIEQFLIGLRGYFILVRWTAVVLGAIGRGISFVVISCLFCALSFGSMLTFLSCAFTGHFLKGIVVSGEQMIMAIFCVSVLSALGGKRLADLGQRIEPRPIDISFRQVD